MRAKLDKPIFNPKRINVLGEAKPGQRGDDRDGRVYVYDEKEELLLALNVALATGRPLLLTGRPGSGKSSVARNVARTKKWRYLDQLITSDTRRDDLLWKFDHVKRLQDAQSKDGVKKNERHYVNPRTLWWALSPSTAKARGLAPVGVEPLAVNHHAKPPADSVPDGVADDESVVVLIDEIDKADPALPNDLLLLLGSGQFDVEEIGDRIERSRPETPEDERHMLVIITTNGERELPAAFLRRCVIFELPDPDEARLIEIAVAHVGEEHRSLIEKIADRAISEEVPGRRKPSVAEFLDTVRTCVAYGKNTHPDEELWDRVMKLSLFKPTRTRS